MTKISIETKIKAIEEYCTTASSLRGIARKYGIAKLDFQICVGIYARFGKEKLLNPPTATGDFRLNLVKWKQQNLASIPETCIPLWLSFIRLCLSMGVSVQRTWSTSPLKTTTRKEIKT